MRKQPLSMPGIKTTGNSKPLRRVQRHQGDAAARRSRSVHVGRERRLFEEGDEARFGRGLHVLVESGDELVQVVDAVRGVRARIDAQRRQVAALPRAPAPGSAPGGSSPRRRAACRGPRRRRRAGAGPGRQLALADCPRRKPPPTTTRRVAAPSSVRPSIDFWPMPRAGSSRRAGSRRWSAG